LPIIGKNTENFGGFAFEIRDRNRRIAMLVRRLLGRLTQGKVIGTYSILTAAEQGINPNFISLGQINVHSVLIAINGEGLQKLNLDAGSLSCVGVAGCDSTTTKINPGFLPMAVTSTADGTKSFIAGSSKVATLDVTANTLTTSPALNGGYLVLAANEDGTVFDARMIYPMVIAATS
jgi:hypothetical protein